MSNYPDIELQEAILKKLLKNASLVALFNGQLRFVDFGVDDIVAPYLVLEQSQLTPWNTSTEIGFQHIFDFNIFSTYNGTKEVRQIAGEIYNSLNYKTDFDLQGFTVIDCQFTGFNVFREADGQSYHGVASYIATIERLI